MRTNAVGTDESGRGFRRRGVLGLAAAGALLPGWADAAAAQVTSSARVPGSRVPGRIRSPSEDDEQGLVDVGLAELGRRMSEGSLDARTLTAFYLDRIERMNRRGPELRAVIEINPEAMSDAARLDAERRNGRVRGPLHGIPILLKDLFDTADPMHTTAGSLALVGSRPARDSTAAARLRRAGAVFLGKANLSEWAGGMSMRSSGGLSARGGQGRNPYSLDRSPGDSSSGSATAAAASLCAVALGTETNGSIIGPAAVNGVVGIKPTVGLTSRAGVIPGSPSMDSVGPIGRTVADAAAVLGIIAGPDPLDPATAAARPHARDDYTEFLDPDGLRGARIGVPRNVYFGYSHHADRVTERALRVLRDAGATLVDPADIPTASELGATDVTSIVQVYEVRRALDTYLRTTPGEHPKDLAGIIAFNDRHADVELKHFPQDALRAIQETSGSLDEPSYRKALRTMRQLSREQGIDAVLRRHRLDALVLPTAPPPGRIDLVNGDSYLGSSSTPAAMAGYPAISVPAGFAAGLPLGITLIGAAWSEPVLIRLAYAYEQAAGARRTPRYGRTEDE